MPLTSKGEKIKSALTAEYGAKKAEEVLYAGKNKGTFTGIDAMSAQDALSGAAAAGDSAAARAMSGSKVSHRK